MPPRRSASGHAEPRHRSSSATAGGNSTHISGRLGGSCQGTIPKGRLVMHYAGLAISAAEAADRIRQHMDEDSTSYLLQ
eukprot:990133-Rhodomonas_salina.1